MLRRIFKWSSIYVVLAVIMPIGFGTAMALARGWPDSWRGANWSSSGLLEDAAARPEAHVIILAVRTGRWKSIFAEHMSIVLKAKHAASWTRYDVVGWGDPVRRDAYAADAFWYGNKPYVVKDIAGPAAEALIPEVEAAITRYPHAGRGTYAVWPGPNSNSFVAWVVRNTKGFAVELPPVAVGKDYLGDGLATGRAASGTGFVISAWGIIGLTLALDEGLELNLLGTSIGIDPGDLAIKLPSLGKLSLFDLASFSDAFDQHDLGDART